MKTRLLVLIVAATAILSCAGQRSGPDLHSLAYLHASPGNQQRIAAGKVGLDMTIDECRAAWPESHFQFVNAFQAGPHRYETWKVDTYSSAKRTMLWIYLETKDGLIDDISEIRKR